MSASTSRPEPWWSSRRFARAAFALTVLGLLSGGAAWLLGRPHLANRLWQATIVLVLLPLAIDIAASLRRRELGVDAIALLAMAGALAFGESLAGAVVALMLSGGEMLEIYAAARARKELSALVERAPRVVHRYEDDHLADPPIEAVRPGDRLLVKPGEIVPVDGVLASPGAVLDESALTGEATPVDRRTGDRVPSGGVNAGGPFDLRAVATAEESTYAAIVRLVREAEASRPPFVRLADRYSLLFLPLTLAVAGLAWLLSGHPVRALAVLVVATPCPLILAAPVAFIAGISRAAQRGIIIKGGAVIEGLARARTLLLDKTGTLTTGVPAVARIETFDSLPPDELLRLAASLDQVSPHVLAGAIVAAARDRELPLTFPTGVTERLGAGIEGRVDGREVALGKASWVKERTGGGGPLAARLEDLRRAVAAEGQANVFVAVDGRPAGAIVLADPIREDSAATLAEAPRPGDRAAGDGDRRSPFRGRAGRPAARDGRGAGGPLAGGEGRGRESRERQGAHGDGGGRRQRRAGPRRRHRGDRHGGPRRHRLLGGGRRRADARPPRPPGGRPGDLPPLARDRPPERARRHGPLPRRHDRGRLRLSPAPRRRPLPGGDRRGGDPQRPAGAGAGEHRQRAYRYRRITYRYRQMTYR